MTLAPTVTLVDSGELILAARTLGVAHPPGFPLYLLLAHAASMFPLGNIAERIHVASALFAALGSAAMMLLVTEAMLLTADRGGTSKKASRKKSDRAEKAFENKTQDAHLVLTIAPAMIAGLLFVFSRTLWAYATIAEVYTLNSLLIVVIFWLMLGWRRARFESRADQVETNNLKLYLAAFIFGLALGVHHVTVGLMLPAIAGLVYSTEGIGFFKSKRFLYAALISVAGLSIYIYLPLAASHSPLMNWGDPRTLEHFWWHITGKQYQTFFDFSPFRSSEFLRLASREFGASWLPLALGLAAAGFVSIFRGNRWVFGFLSLIIVADAAYCMCYEIAEDKDAYYLPAFISLTIAAGFGARSIINGLQKTKLRNTLTPIRTAIILLIIPLIALTSNFGFNNRSNYFIAHDYVDNIFRSVEPRGMLLTSDWQVYSPSLYVREIENQRRDVVVININQIRRSWYYDYLDQAYPEVTEKSRREINAFLQDLRSWESDPAAFGKSEPLTRRINSRFYEMIVSFATNQIKDAPVYLTPEIAGNRRGKDAELTKALIEKFKFVPKGLVFRVGEKTGPDDYGDPQILIRGLNDGTLKFDVDDVVTKKVLPVYLNIAMISGTYFAAQGSHGRAILRFKQALANDPTLEPAKRALAASQSALQQQRSN
ncbi:MAG: DUF2723 domain-containing protein [Pyrinomonadaceae bacterium]